MATRRKYSGVGNVCAKAREEKQRRLRRQRK
jgi:hypothetical protein